MKPTKRIFQYAKENFNEVVHTTLNPEGPGVVRIHLVPPAYSENDMAPSVAIINGQDIIPVGISWSVLLCEFIKEVNKFDGKPIEENDIDVIIKNTCTEVKKVFPLIGRKRLSKDIYRIFNAFKQIAYGEEVDENIGYLNMGEYSEYMNAPHRMDLMISAMTKNDVWHCNQRCVHCYAAGQKCAEEEELSTDDWKAIIDNCKKAMIPQLTFTGGEPTMREDIFELIDYAKWFVTRLNTNGVKLTKDYCRRLKEASLDSLQITFYSYDQDIHNSLVGVDEYDATVRGIENAIEAGLSVSINTPLCIKNKDYLSTLKFLKERGVMYVTCSGLIVTGNALLEESKNLQLSKDEIKNILKEAVEYCYSNDMEISFTSPGWIPKEFFEELLISTPTCGACLSNMAITPGGNVVPCQSWLSDEPLGNMLSDSWEKIWNNERTIERRKYSSYMTGDCPFRFRNEKEVQDEK
ncbi:MAG: radical SAM protein [Lachnospiraceae bacterium]|nr:radical SAM protein [Lachnospiraceae bacterium]